MRDYGKLATRFWTDPVVLGLSKDAKLVFLYLLAGGETNAIGCFRCTPMHIAASEVCSVDEAEAALKELQACGLVECDEKAKVVRLPRWFKYNPICNQSAGKAAVRAFFRTPDTDLLEPVKKHLTDCKHVDNNLLTQVPTQVSTQVRSSESDSESDSDTDTEGEGDTDREIPPAPSSSQLQMILQMCDEKLVALDDVLKELGYQQLDKSNVSAIKAHLKAIPAPDPKKLQTEQKIRSLRGLESILSNLFVQEGDQGRGWIKMQEKRFQGPLWNYFRKLEEAAGEGMAT